MKVSNDFIKIKIGKKEYQYRNLIFDEYFKRIINRQIIGVENNIVKTKIALDYLSIKLDEPLPNINSSSEILVNDMDIMYVDNVDVRLNTSKNKNVIIYSFNLDINGYYGRINHETNQFEMFEGLNEYLGRKIAMIGFQTWFVSMGDWNLKLCAYLDVSKDNIYIQENQNILITRQDSFYTDAEFFSNDSIVNYPLHISPMSKTKIFNEIPIEEEDGSVRLLQTDKSSSKLHSIGFSNNINKIEKEFILGQDIEAIQEINKIIFKNVENRYNGNYIYAQNNLYAGQNLYPLQEKFKYVIYKYKLLEDKWTGEIEYDEEGYPSYIEEPTDTGLYYLQAKEIDLPENKNVDLVLQYDRI